MSQPAKIYLELRKMALTVPPTEIRLEGAVELPHVRGVLMEMGMGEGVATLVCMTDGTTSLYFSNGGGMIGLGEKPAVATACRALLVKAEQYVKSLYPTEEYPLPSAGMVRFYLLTLDGVLTGEAVERRIREPAHQFYELYAAGQDLITQIRLSAPTDKSTK